MNQDETRGSIKLLIENQYGYIIYWKFFSRKK